MPTKKTAPKAAATTKKSTAKATSPAKKAVAEATAAVTAMKAPAEAPAAAVAAKPVASKAQETLTVTMVAEAPADTAVAAPASTETAPLTIGMFQKRLYERGFYNGHWDGQYGPLTKQAVAHFQHVQGLSVNGDATPETIAALGF